MSTKIRKYPDKVLKERAKEVNDFSSMGNLTERMLSIMRENDGIGLAANQIGIANQVFVIQIGEEEEPIRLINPIIIEAEGEDKLEEGCLSVPGASVEIARSESLLIKGFNPDGEEVEYKLNGLEARVAQHEIDHLNGILIVDYLPKREILRFQREYEKMKEEN